MILKKNRGFASAVVLVLAGAAFFIFDRVVNTTFLHSFFAKNYVNQAQSEVLMYLACNKVMQDFVDAQNGKMSFDDEGEELAAKEDFVDPKADANVKKGVEPVQRLRSFIWFLLKKLNKWQDLKLREELDGVDAKISYYLSCEDGKVSVNHVFDSKKKEIKKEYKSLLRNFKISNVDAFGGDFCKNLDKVLQDRNYSDFSDISELVISPKQKTELFATPFIPGEGGNLKQDNRLFLADLFSIHKLSDKLNPLLLDRSVLRIFEGVQAPDVSKNKNIFSIIKNKLTFDLSLSSKHNADLIKLLYQKPNEQAAQDEGPVHGPPTQEEAAQAQEYEVSVLQEAAKLFSKEAEPRLFSLIVQVDLGDFSRRFALIFKKQKILDIDYSASEKLDQASAKTGEISQDSKNSATMENICFLPKGFEIIRIYWL